MRVLSKLLMIDFCTDIVGNGQHLEQAEPKTKSSQLQLQEAQMWNAATQQSTHHNQANAIN